MAEGQQPVIKRAHPTRPCRYGLPVPVRRCAQIQQEESKQPVHDAQTKFRKDYKPVPFIM